MGQWTDRIHSHRIWGALKDLGPAIDRALQSEVTAVDAVDSLERLRTVLIFCGKRLAAVDPVLLTPNSMENLASNLTQIQAHVDSFTSTGDVSQLTSANLQADSALMNVAIVLGAVTADDLTVIGEAASMYRSTLEKHLREALELQRDLREKATANATTLSALEAAITAEQQRLAALITEQQSHFSAAQDKRATEFAASQAEYLAKYSAAIAEQQSQFSTDQDSRRTAFAELQSESQTRFSLLMTKYEETYKDYKSELLDREKQASDAHKASLDLLHTEFKGAATVLLQNMKQKKSEIESLVGVIGNLGVTSGYKKVADQARLRLYVWQSLTVMALIGLVAVAFLSAFPKEQFFPAGNAALHHANPIPSVQNSPPTLQASSDTTFYHGLATRIFLSLTFGIFAAYAGRQASHAFTIEQKNRKLALELEALGPFIEPLEKTDRDKFRVQIGDRSFGVPEPNGLNSKEDDPVSLISLLKSKEFQEVIGAQVREAMKGFR